MMALFDPAKNRGMTAQASLVTAVTLRRIIRSISLYGDKRPRPDEPIGARCFFHLSPSQLFPGGQVLNGLGSRAHLLQPFQHHAQRSISLRHPFSQSRGLLRRRTVLRAIEFARLTRERLNPTGTVTSELLIEREAVCEVFDRGLRQKYRKRESVFDRPTGS
jgi:hypothetical protein